MITGALLTFVVTLCPAQNYHHQDWWYFGGNRGIHFGPTHPPTVDFNSQMNTWEGCATRSDKAGNLLFYTHGHQIWDATHTQMPTPTGYIYGQTGPINSVRQGANIICDAYRPNQYYVFTIGGQTLQLDSLQYFKVNMNLPGNGTPANPLGDVVAGTERTHVAAGRTEAFTAIRHANKRDWWIITTTSSKLEVFLLNSIGVNTTPVYSGTGGAGTASFPDLGWLRGSHDGTKLYSGAIGGGSAYLFDFNNATGIPSNRLAMPSSNDAEFSPNNRFLYLTHYVGNNSNVVQYDLSLAPALIVPSAITVGTKATSFGMGLLVGPDRRLYVSQQNMLGIINNPNNLGVACNFDNNPLATFGIFSFWQSTGSMLSFHQTWEPIYDTAGFTVSN